METDITTESRSDPEQTDQRSPAVVPPPLDNATAALIVCKFFQVGRCRRGTNCRFIHPTDGESAETSPTGEENKKCKNSDTPASTASFDLSKCIDAPVFVPKSRMLDEMCSPNDEQANTEDAHEHDENETNEQDEEDGGGARCLSYASIVTANNNHNGGHDRGRRQSLSPLCPYFEKHGRCAMPDCVRKHGLKCDLCNRFCMHPDDPAQRQRHTAECIKQHEQDMEHSFAVQRSRDKTCGICLEVILEKRPREQRFGILPNCKHIFCLSCIRTWRKANNFENKIKRGCPTCRIASDFVCPSYVWIENDDDKKKLIEDYKQACNATDCMHFKKGAANCPFGNKCFYRHALVTGELIDVGAPPRRRERNHRTNASQGFRLEELFERFLAPRHAMMLDEYGVTFLTDDEDSDYDDLDLYDMEMNYVGITDLYEMENGERLRSDSFDSDIDLIRYETLIRHYEF